MEHSIFWTLEYSVHSSVDLDLQKGKICMLFSLVLASSRRIMELSWALFGCLERSMCVSMKPSWPVAQKRELEKLGKEAERIMAT